MQIDYCFLTEKEEMWARMLMQVLEDNQIPCESLPVYGAGLVLRGGVKEYLRVFVPIDQHYRARQLMDELFSAQP